MRFRIEVAEELIGTFRSRKRAGRRRSSEMDRLKVELGHWPIQVPEKRECVACNVKRAKQNLSRSQFRHETRFKCSYCDIHLCIDKDRNCFTKYHTLVCYWNRTILVNMHKSHNSDHNAMYVLVCAHIDHYCVSVAVTMVTKVNFHFPMFMIVTRYIHIMCFFRVISGVVLLSHHHNILANNHHNILANK